MTIRTLYLFLAVVGAVIPYVFFVQHFQVAGIGLGSFVGALFANGAAGGFSADLLISSLVFWISIFARNRRHDGPSPWPYVAVNLLVGLSCALPLYLAMSAHKHSPAAA